MTSILLFKYIFYVTLTQKKKNLEINNKQKPQSLHIKLKHKKNCEINWIFFVSDFLWHYVTFFHFLL